MTSNWEATKKEPEENIKLYGQQASRDKDMDILNKNIIVYGVYEFRPRQIHPCAEPTMEYLIKLSIEGSEDQILVRSLHTYVHDIIKHLEEKKTPLRCQIITTGEKQGVRYRIAPPINPET